MLYSIIMAGGSGTRFWPASRRAYPKQLLPIGTPRSLIEVTVERISGLMPAERIFIITNAVYAEKTRELLHGIPPQNVIGEPVGRDTAACIGLAALVLAAKDPRAVMAVMPSDHVITPSRAFCASLAAAEETLRDRPGALVAFGIEPAYPATGFGYIKRRGEGRTIQGLPFFEVEAFHEKPDLAKAETFLEEGGYLWNAGIFIWRADTVLELIARFLPELHGGLKAIEPSVGTSGFERAVAEVYPHLEKISIDYGIMEKAPERLVAAVNYAWDDVGSWRALERLLPADGAGNRVEGENVLMGAKNNIVSARDGMVGLIGVEGLIVVHTPDATLVCRKEDAEAVKKLVESLGEAYQ